MNVIKAVIAECYSSPARKVRFATGTTDKKLAWYLKKFEKAGLSCWVRASDSEKREYSHDFDLKVNI